MKKKTNNINNYNDDDLKEFGGAFGLSRFEAGDQLNPAREAREQRVEIVGQPGRFRRAYARHFMRTALLSLHHRTSELPLHSSNIESSLKITY